MLRKQLVASVCWAVAVVVALAIGPAVTAQDAQKAPQQPAVEKAKEKKADKPLRISLPPYFAKIVDAKQKEQIYAIQREYVPKIQELKAQLEALQSERDKKIDAVLSPEQRKQLADLKAARAKRKPAAEPKPEKPAKSG